MDGPLLDYALKKRNLLLNTNPNLAEDTQINFIVLGLPSQLHTHVGKKNCSSIYTLMACIRQLEGLMPKKNEKKSKIDAVDTQKKKVVENSCSFCAKKGFPDALESCRLLLAEKKKSRNDKIKVVNSTNIEDSISSSDESKNE